MGRARDQYSITGIELVTGGKERKEKRQTIFFTPLDRFNSDADEAESITSTTKLRKVQYQIHWRFEQDTVYLFICPLHKMLVFNLANGFWCHYYAPFCSQTMRRQECQRNWDERNVRETAHTSRTTKNNKHSNTQTIMGPNEVQYWKHASGNREEFASTELRPACCMETHLAEGGNWTEQSAGLRVEASPTTKFTKTNSACKESQKTSENLWLQMEF